MADFYALAPQHMSVQIRHYSPGWGDGKIYSGTLSGFNNVASYFRARPVVASKNKPSLAEHNSFLHVYQSVSPSDPPFTSVETSVVHLENERTSNPKFRERQRAGEIILSPLRVAKATKTVQKRVDLSQQPSLGRYSIASFIDGMSNSELFAALQRDLPGRWINRFQIAPAYDRKAVPTVPAYSFSPEIDVSTFRSPFEIDPALVTAALGDSKSAVYDVLTEIAELPEMVAYLGDKVKTIVQLGIEHRRRASLVKKLPVVKQISALASLELQFRYAVMPIVYSIQSIRSLLEEYGRQYRETRSRGDFDLGDPFKSPFFVGSTGSCTNRVFIKTRYDPAAVIQQLFLLIGPNPVATLWELTPWSFVLDWVINIGDFIAALTTLDVSSEMAACASTKVDLALSYKYDTTSDMETVIRLESYVRQPINPQDHIGLYIRPVMNWKRWLDAFALSWQSLKIRS